MSKSNISKLFPWIVSAAAAWTLGFWYNVHGGGELSWFKWMYEQKIAYAAQKQQPHRILLAGGSGVHFSVNAGEMEKQLGIPVFNLGLQGDLGLNIILPLVLEQVRPGDIVLLIPEYLMLVDKDGFGEGDGLYGSVPFPIVIGQPGLGNPPEKKLFEDTWRLGIPTLKALTKSGIELVEKGRTTGYHSDPITENGDATIAKERFGEWWKLHINQSISKHSLQAIAQFRKDLEAKGAHLIVGLPWIYGGTDAKTIENLRISAEKLSRIAPVLYNSDTMNIQSDSNIFADTHYHLQLPARLIRSSELAEQIQPYLAEYVKQSERLPNSKK